MWRGRSREEQATSCYWIPTGDFIQNVCFPPEVSSYIICVEDTQVYLHSSSVSLFISQTLSYNLLAHTNDPTQMNILGFASVFFLL